MGIAIATGSFRSFASDERRYAATALLFALALGVTTQALFWHAGVGLNFFVWDALLVGANVVAFRRGPMRAAARGAIAAALMLGLSVVRFESAWTLAIALPWTMGILAVLPMLLRDELDLAALANVPWRLFGLARWVPRAIGAVVRMPGIAAGERARSHVGRVTLGLVMGAPIAGFFALLFASDDAFASAMGAIRRQVGEAMLFVTWSLMTSCGLLVSNAVHHLDGAMRAQLEDTLPAAGPYRGAPEETMALAKTPMSPMTWSLVIGQVALVFALFVGANLRTLFGGHAVVRAADGPTYAAYLHAGFSQFLFATVLSVCLVLGGHMLLKRGASGAAVPGGALLKGLEAALLALTGVTLLSCWQRLRIYEDAYGASHLRLGVAFIEIAIFGLLALTLVKVLARAWRGHGGAVLALGAAMAVLACGINADAYVARTNLDRAARGEYLDEEYLVSLSGDAREVLSHPVVKRDPALGMRLFSRYCAKPTGDWRAARGFGACEEW